MPNIGSAKLQEYSAILANLGKVRMPWKMHWRELADNYLPSRYDWLLSDGERAASKAINQFILDSTGTQGARTLAAGLLNGITSPSRPWFKLRIPGLRGRVNKKVQQYLDEVERRMLMVFAESNMYNAMGIMYLDLSIFGTAACLIYEDFDSVVNFYNPPLGEYYLAGDATNRVDYFAREFNMQIRQVIDQWPDPSLWSERIQQAKALGGARLFETVQIAHVIETNDGSIPSLNYPFPYRELYWERKRSTNSGTVLQASGLFELNGIFPRWEATSVYGVSPGMDALPDVIQLQHETKAKGKALDWMNRPAIVAPVELQNQPNAFMPGGVSFISGSNNITPQALHTVNPPLGEMSADIKEVQLRIREVFYNHLFNMISQLGTVRSATEIEARQEEKLVMLGGVLERFENEALDPMINRVFGIMNRAGLLPEAPEELEDLEIEIQYESILSVAQRAVGTIPTERFLQFIGQLSPLYPSVLNIPDIDQLARDYGIDTGVKASGMRSEDEVAELVAQDARQAEAAQALEAGSSLAQSAKTLSETDVGGGANALQQLVG